MYSPRTGQARLGQRPSKKSIKRVVEQVHELTVRAHTWQETTELVAKLNRTLRGWANGTVNLSGRASRMQATGSGHRGLSPTHATDLGPDSEFLGPGSSMLGGSDVIAAEVEKVVDLIVG